MHRYALPSIVFPYTTLFRSIEILKSFGVNAIRTSHNPPAPELLDLADKMGILILDEAFDAWTGSKRKNDYATLFKDWHEKEDRKSTRLNSSHLGISYAVFCL